MRKLSLALCAAVLAATPAAAQHDMSGPIVEAVANDIRQVEQKLVGLAEAIPEDNWGWRPGDGVRSIGEVFMHVAADNYFIPAMVGAEAPAATGIRGDDYNTAVAYETRAMNKAQTIEAMRASFAHLYGVLQMADHDALMSTHDFFGNEMTGLQILVLTATHLHEHLGQQIAYASSYDITPPWSRN